MSSNRVVHFEYVAENPGKLVVFYKEVFGWKIQTWGGPQAYWLLETGNNKEAGIDGGVMGAPGPGKQKVINTIQVSSLEKTIKKIKQFGGSTISQKNTILGVGYHYYCKDIEGNIFGILESEQKAK